MAISKDVEALKARAKTQQEQAAAQQKGLLAQTTAKDTGGFQAAGASLAGSAHPLVSGFGRGMAAVSAIKEGSKREQALKKMEAFTAEQLHKQQTMQTAIEEANLVNENITNATPTAVDIIGDLNKGMLTKEDADKRITELFTATSPKMFAGTKMSYNPELASIEIVSPDGEVEREGMNDMINRLPDDMKPIAYEKVFGVTTEGAEIEGEAKRTEAEATLDRGLKSGESEALAGVVQRTQEVPAYDVSPTVVERSGGIIQTPQQLEAANNANQKIYENAAKDAVSTTNTASQVANNMNRAISIINTAESEGRKVSGLLSSEEVDLRKFGDAIGMDIDLSNVKDYSQLQSIYTDAAVNRMKDLGGNDSEQELQKIESIAGTMLDQQQVLKMKAEALRGSSYKLGQKAEFLSKYTEGQPALVLQSEGAYSRAVREIDPRLPTAEISKLMNNYLDPTFQPTLDENGFVNTIATPTQSTAGTVNWADIQ